MYARRNNGGGMGWDGDAGQKHINPTLMWEHIRVYGAGGSMYNTEWGTYCFASTHYDYNELHQNQYQATWFGYSEGASDAAYDTAQLFWGASHVHRDNADFHNAETERYETAGGETHIWQNDGRRSSVNVVE